MNQLKTIIPFISLCLLLASYNNNKNFRLANVRQTDTAKLVVPLGGNSFITIKEKAGKETITNEGWENWQSEKAIFSTYIKVNKPGSFEVMALLNIPQGESKIRCTINNKSRLIGVNGTTDKEYTFGGWEITKAGYVRINMQGVSKTGSIFANIKELHIAGTSIDDQTAYVKNNEGNYFYW